MKKANSDQMESIEFYLDKTKQPIAYNAKLKELIGAGMTKVEAENFIDETPLCLEMYYSADQGLFMVESEAVESCEIYNPYNGEMLEESDEF